MLATQGAHVVLRPLQRLPLTNLGNLSPLLLLALFHLFVLRLDHFNSLRELGAILDQTRMKDHLVHSHVSVHLRARVEALVADDACVWLFSSVRAKVHRVFHFISERLGTHRAEVNAVESPLTTVACRVSVGQFHRLTCLGAVDDGIGERVMSGGVRGVGGSRRG